jgi:hypothetical protein
MAKPARLLILERARALIEDGRHGVRATSHGMQGASQLVRQTATPSSVAPSARSWQRLINSPATLIVRKRLQMVAMRPVIGATSLTHVNDAEGHAAI